MFDAALSRRAFFAVSGTAFASAWLAADPDELRASLAHAARARAAPRAPAWEFFTAEQAADVEAIAAQIVPSDDTPGAREARVVSFVDHSLATWAVPQREPFSQGLDQLNGEVEKRWPGAGRFASLPPERQLELLRAQEQTPFFRQMRFATLVGMFSMPSYGGNAGKLGWRLIGFEDRYVWQPPFGDYDAAAAGRGH
jgi:gluconate 2-dehydrogenase gamma chain